MRGGRSRKNMFKILRMICAIIAAACAVACVIVAVNWGMIPFWGCLAGGVFFFVLCLLFKFLQEDKEGGAKKDENNAPSDPLKSEALSSDDRDDRTDNAAESDRHADDRGGKAN